MSVRSEAMATLESGRLRQFAIQAGLTAALALAGTVSAQACKPGNEACPVVLHMAPGAVSVTGTGVVSGTHPNFYFKFRARAGQVMTVAVKGGDIKTGPGIPLTFPNGGTDAVYENSPYTLPQTGSYTIVMHANTMSDGPFGRFWMTLTIK
jgi:hypothetical protein